MPPAIHFLDVLPFDWSRAESQELLRALVAAYPESDAITNNPIGVELLGGTQHRDTHVELEPESFAAPARFPPQLVGMVEGVARMTAETTRGRLLATAFLIAPDLVLTADYVLRAPAEVLAVKVDFTRRDGSSIHLAGRVDTIADDRVSGWAAIRLDSVVPDGLPMLKIAATATPSAGDPLFAIGYPGGAAEAVCMEGMVRSVNATSVDDRMAAGPGAGGSPIFSAGGEIVALHHSAGLVDLPAGAGQEYLGTGKLMSRIHDDLVARGLVAP